jgi:hypothetical protein
LNHTNPVRPEPVEGVNGIYVVHPIGECEETRSCFDSAQHERVSSRPTDFFRFKHSRYLTWAPDKLDLEEMKKIAVCGLAFAVSAAVRLDFPREYLH